MAEIIELPGLIDMHVHLRDPWQLQKEDFYTGTSAALAGGFTTVFDMPNNEKHIISEELLDRKITSAKSKIVCDLGFYFSALSSQTIAEFEKVKEKAAGLKLFITTTTNMDNLRALNDKKELVRVFDAWRVDKPILLHAEDDAVELGLYAARQTKRRTHFCHISSRQELEPILKAKAEGLPVTCGVTPHHLFLTIKDKEKLGRLGVVKPNLKPKSDQDFLWENLDAIDAVESDHAPHTKEEKLAKPTIGIPGVETLLPLMLTAEQKGRITTKMLIDKLYTKPAEILGIKPDKNTKIEVEMSEYQINEKDLKTKCAWSPYDGWKVIGKVKKVYLRGNLVFENGKILAEPGSGKIIS